jgi:asparagine synthase (glutamine-hydrolysing)
MSAVLGIFAADTAPADARRMLDRMQARGADARHQERLGPALLATARHHWELGSGFSGPVGVVRDGALAVAADATLYYVDDLRRALAARGVEPTGPTPAHLVLAAYRAWGDACPAHLEGDFAFVLWDGDARRVLCARDFGGKRPLFHARMGDALVVASTLAAVRAHPDCPDALNLAALAEDALGLTGSPDETVYGAVSRLGAGCSLAWSPGEQPRVTRHWEPPAFADHALRGAADFDDAAMELRDTLSRAVDERRSTLGATGVWLSGGWDSPAVFAAGRHALRNTIGGAELRPVSISYPPGDPGREDELIGAVVDHWKTATRWLPIARVPGFDPTGTARRDEPMPHPFEMVNRALSRETRLLGARVALDGNGGDQLFQVSAVAMADLVRRGRWTAALREWRAEGGGGKRAFLRAAIRPHLARDAFRRAAPAWLDGDFARRHGLHEREARHTRVRGAASLAARESRWYLTRPLFPRMSAYLAGFALESGVEHRSPLYDARLVALAARRPVDERRSGGETKRLLRRAMRGLLPDAFLAPRAHRTGVPVHYLLRSVRACAADLDPAHGPLRLAELGIVDEAALRRGWSEFQRTASTSLGAQLFFTLQAERWLRAQAGEGSADGGMMDDDAPVRMLAAV